jgi:hypothetical protein
LKCLDDCGQTPGFEVPWPDSAMNWLGEPTPDQKRMEEVLAKRVTPESELLHVGIGNSSFAARFSPLVKWIDGITLGEKEVFMSGDLPNYVVYRMNKYDPIFAETLRQYDFIVDNAFGCYACCVRHFHGLMETYARILKPGGMILTDRAGLNHAPGDPNWNLTNDIQEIADRFSLTLTAETDMVYALRK